MEEQIMTVKVAKETDACTPMCRCLDIIGEGDTLWKDGEIVERIYHCANEKTCREALSRSREARDATR